MSPKTVSKEDGYKLLESIVKAGVILYLSLPKIKDGQFKYIIILGEDKFDSGTELLYVFVNSKINKYYDRKLELKYLHIPLVPEKDAGLITKKCYANCADPKTLSKEGIISAIKLDKKEFSKCVGVVQPDCLTRLKQAIRDNPIILKPTKKRFGLL